MTRGRRANAPAGPIGPRSNRLPSRRIAVLFALISVSTLPMPTPSVAQTATATAAEDPFNEMLAPGRTGRRAAPPRLALVRLGEIPLPGPLPPGSPSWVDGAIRVDAAGGARRVDPDSERVTPAPAGRPASGPPPDAWVHAEDGTRRFRSVDSGAILAEKRCRRCKRGWRRCWKLRVPGRTVAAPLVVGKRVYFGALDNRVYAVRARNGHRVWVADAGGRMTRPPVLWSGSVHEGPATPSGASPPDDGAVDAPIELLLIVPDGESELVVLDAAGGSRVTAVGFPSESGELVGVPAVLPDGRVAVAFDKYDPGEAALVLYRFERPVDPPEEEIPGEDPARPEVEATPGSAAGRSGPMDYNAAVTSVGHAPAGPSGFRALRAATRQLKPRQ